LKDDEVYTADCKMDPISNNTLSIFSPDLIMDTNTIEFKVKDAIFDFVGEVKAKIDDNKKTFWIVTGCILIIIVVFFVFKVTKWITRILSVLPEKKDKNKRE
jgi:hypothetical protein